MDRDLSFLNYLSDGILEIASDWRVAYANERAQLLYRKRRAEIEGSVLWELFPHLEGVPEQDLRAAHAEKRARRLKVFHPGLYAWHDMWACPSQDGLVLVVRDVTDNQRMRVQESVREAIRDIVEQAPVAITLLRGSEHRVEVMNAFARRLLGGRDLEGQALRSALPELEGQGILDLLDSVYTTGQPVTQTGMAIRYDRHGTGELYEGTFDLSYTAVRDADGSISGVLGVNVEV